MRIKQWENKYQHNALWTESEVKWVTKLNIKNQENSGTQCERLKMKLRVPPWSPWMKLNCLCFIMIGQLPVCVGARQTESTVYLPQIYFSYSFRIFGLFHIITVFFHLLTTYLKLISLQLFHIKLHAKILNCVREILHHQNLSQRAVHFEILPK